MLKSRLGYLSGAPRVSTIPEARAAGARAHVLGVIRAFEELGCEVKPFIAGDRVPRKWILEGSEQAAGAGLFQKLAADLLRLGMGLVNAGRAWWELGGDVDWIYERSAVFQALGWIFKRRGIPWVLEINAPFFYEAAVERNSIVLGRVARWLEIKAYRGCDVLVCVSEALKEIVVSEADVEPEKVVVLPNGVDVDRFDPGRHEAKRLSEDLTIGFVGTLLAWQGLDLLLEALKDLKAEGMEMHLVVVGDGPTRRELEEQARRSGISANVTFAGWAKWQDVPRFISGFDVGYSGQIQMQIGAMYHSPIKIYEYMAMSKPVVASAFEDARRVIRDGETGYLFEGGNKADLERALAEAFRDRDELREMGRQAREEIVAHHSWVARVKTLVSEVERVRARS